MSHNCKFCNESNSEWTSEYLIKTCRDMNEKYFDHYNSNTSWNAQEFGWIGFIYESCDFVDAIKYNDIILWNSENDEREYCDHCDKGYHTESIGDYVERQFIKYCEMLKKCYDEAMLDEFYNGLREKGMKMTNEYKEVSVDRDTCPACGSTEYDNKEKFCPKCVAFCGEYKTITTHKEGYCGK